jgi:hypothetical protein
MGEANLRRMARKINVYTFSVVAILVIALRGSVSFAQVDQGAITGVVSDTSGAVVRNAQVTVTNVDTGLALQTHTNETGIYVVSPLKIGNYTVSATAQGFETTQHENLHLDAQQRLSVNLALRAGAVSETVTVTSAAPMLDTEQGSVGQVISTQTINDTPLNGRNWVYIAQLTAGVAPPFGNTRGSGTGDFVANGQRAEQNNFILDGVDNNTNLVDFLNGSSYVMRPPPDALSEFSLQTSNFSAEFGHSAGGVMNASIKSGTNHIHGDLWEYVRNTSLDAIPWNAGANAVIPPYHQNQFGATLGFPIWKNKLFYFGDLEVNRILISNPSIFNIPTALMQQGNFSELLNPTLTGAGVPTLLYEPNSADPAKPLVCNGQQNVFCPGQLNQVALNILKLYPGPNTNGGKVYNNYNTNIKNQDNTFQWDQRLDWNVTTRDQAYVRYSYLHEIKVNGLPLGPILDGSGYGGEYDTNLAENFMGSETHIFTPRLTNELRFGYNWGVFHFRQPNAFNSTLATSLGLGPLPSDLGPGQLGLPLGYVNGTIQQWGSSGTSNESQNVYQILDNVTKIWGNHSMKFGVNFQAVRFFYIYAPADQGQYHWDGQFTGIPGSTAPTGSAVADMLVDQENYATISHSPNVNDAQWYNAAYAQDDWKILPNLTLNLGVRYDYFQPYKENAGQQANFIVTGPLGIGTGSGVVQFPDSQKNIDLGSPFLSVLAKDNVSVQFVSNDRLVTAQKTNFAPRVGFAWGARPSTVIRGGFGIFYGGLQSEGNGNLGANFPYSNQAQFFAPSCTTENCPSLAAQGITLVSGLVPAIGAGLQSFVSYPGFHATDPNVKTPYTIDFSFGMQQAITPNLSATISYVGNLARHLELYGAPNTAPGLWAPGTNTQPFNPFPDLGGVGELHFAGVSTYNALQAKLEKRYAHGLSFLATYTWSHALDDASDAGGLFNAIGDRNLALIPFIDELTNSVFDIRNRFTINGNYELPFGRGRALLNSSKWEDETVGGWSTSLTWAAQTGTPFSVSPNISTAANGGARAIPVRDPFAPGGSPDPSNPNLTECPTQVKNKTNWYNPCAFRNPLPGNLIGTAQYPSPITDAATAIAFLGGRSNNVYGPGYYQVNMSLFKTFPVWREQNLQFRADSFNVLNHPTLANPSATNDNSNGGNITGPKTFQNNTPDARFFQLSLKYTF